MSSEIRLREASVAVVLGTRPELVKLAALIRLLGPSCLLVHTGQHYDEAMSGTFLRDLGISSPSLSLGVGGASRGRQIAEALLALDDLFQRDRPDVVVVQGDTNSTLGGALAANTRGVPLVHIEAGMRSFDERMAEEHNRILTDHVATVCCAPTALNAANLVREGIPSEKIFLTGHTVVDAVREHLPDTNERAGILLKHGLDPAGYIMATFHRAENVDDEGALELILASLGKLSVPVVWPVHPRTRSRIEEFELSALLADVMLVEPLRYSEFLALCAESALIVTDSGGIQVEATEYCRPLVVVRDTTEYPEIVGTFASLVPPDGDIVEAAEAWLDRAPGVFEELREIHNPYGEGNAAARCLEAIAAAR